MSKNPSCHQKRNSSYHNVTFNTIPSLLLTTKISSENHATVFFTVHVIPDISPQKISDSQTKMSNPFVWHLLLWIITSTVPWQPRSTITTALTVLYSTKISSNNSEINPVILCESPWQHCTVALLGWWRWLSWYFWWDAAAHTQAHCLTMSPSSLPPGPQRP